MSFDFHHITPIEIRFADMDAMGHVNNASYLTYIEIARIRYFDDVLRRDIDFSQQGFILARASVDFILPIELKDKIEVRTRCSRIGSKSFDLEYEMVKMNHEPPVIVAKAQTVLVGYDYMEKKSVILPDAWKKRIEEFEKRNF